MSKSPPRNGEVAARRADGGGPAILQSPIKQVKRARKLRREMSLPEVLLWRVLRTQPGGYRFRRQFPIAGLTIDFACLSARLAIEVDSEAHNRGDQPQIDLDRDAKVESQGFRTIRIPAVEILRNLEDCIMGIVEACREAGPPPPSLRDGPPPRSGEDFQ